MPTEAKVDWEAAQRDRDSGMGVVEIANKYDVSTPTVYAHTRTPRRNQRTPGRKPKPDGPQDWKRGPKSASRASARNGDVPRLVATAELCDGIWAALSLEKKAALLNKLPET